MEKRRSPWIPIILAVVIGLMVIVLLNNVLRPVSVVVAKAPIAPGTRLTAELLELRTIPAQSRPRDAFARIEEVQDRIVAIGRAPGDYIVASALGETAQAGIPANLPADHLAIAVRVDLATGLAGLLREGQTVTLIGMLSPEVLQSVAAASPIGQPGFLPKSDSRIHLFRSAYAHAYPDAHPGAAGGSAGAHRDQRVESADGAAVVSIRGTAGRLDGRAALRQRAHRFGSPGRQCDRAGCSRSTD